MRKVYIAGGVRTPIGKTGGILKDFLPEQLGAVVLNEILRRYSLNDVDIDKVLLGNVVGTGGNIARVAVLEAGWGFSSTAITIDTQCGSALSALDIAGAFISSGQAELIIAGGMESTSLAPKRRFHDKDPRYKGADFFYEQAPFSPEHIGNPDIGEAAEYIAGKFNITREAMDEQALHSHKRATEAIEKGYLADVIKTVECAGKELKYDEGPKKGMNMKLLSRLRGAFIDGGMITAGNSCLKHDGAAAILLASEEAVKKYALCPVAELCGASTIGYDPNLFPLSPVPAIKKLLHDNCLNIGKIDAIEVNEAFAVKVLVCCDLLGIDTEKVNRLGGALAYGHPYGASGAIIVLHLLKTLEIYGGKYGVASIGAVGGTGSALLVKRCCSC